MPGISHDVTLLAGADLRRFPPETRLLAAAGVLATCRRAGFPVATARAGARARPEPAPPDPRPPAPDTAAQLLDLVLAGAVAVAGGPVPLVGTWLDRCCAAGHKLPARFLPTVLDLGARAKALRPAALAAGGPALLWLAAHNRRWAWAAGTAAAAEGAAPAEVWRTGDGPSRTAVLRRLREIDPRRALELVRDTWPGEKAADRVAIIGELSIGLGPDDEPFLEAALDDRARGVRAAAADRLAALPSSRLAGRMAERLRPLVRISPGRAHPLRVELPGEPDAAARRDGVTDQGAPPGTGLRSWWLEQLIGATPLAFWTDALGGSIDGLVSGADQAEVVRGWARAAVRQRESAWAAALLGTGHAADDAGLLSVLAPDQARGLAPSLLRRCTDAHLAELLGAVPGPWSQPLTTAVVERLAAVRSRARVLACLPHVAARADPSGAGPLDEHLAAVAGEVAPAVHALTLRRSILEAFA